MPHSEFATLLLTVIHSGTRSVVAQLKKDGHKVKSFHFTVPGWRYVDQGYDQLTIVRNPWMVARSWRSDPTFDRFAKNNWEEQWTMWHKAVTKHDFKVIVIENFNYPVMGQTEKRPSLIQIPLDKVQFAMDLIKDSGIEYPDYYGAEV